MTDERIEDLLRPKVISPAVRDERAVRQFDAMLWNLARKAHRQAGVWTGDEVEDLHADAATFLLEVLDLYDPDRPSPKTGKPVKFISYAYPYVWGKLRALVKTRNGLIRVPSYQLDRNQTPGPYAADAARALSLHGFAADADGQTFDPAGRGPDPATGETDEALAVLWALPLMPGRLRTVITRRFGLDGREPQTFQEVGDTLRLSRERIRQLQEQGLQLLHRLVRQRLRDGRVPENVPEVVRLAAHMHVLPARQREVFQLVALDGVAVCRAAQQLGVTHGAVQGARRWAYARLRACLGQGDDLADLKRERREKNRRMRKRAPAACRHCRRRKGCRPRGLCWTCYGTPGVRDRYPSESKFARKSALAGAAGKDADGRGRGGPGEGMYTSEGNDRGTLPRAGQQASA